MLAVTGSNTESVVVYVQLLDEGTVVYRPTRGQLVGEGAVRLLPTPGYDPDDEHWEFPPGSVVRCQPRNLEGTEVLVAHALVD
jgi:hypothetical protein